MDLGLHLTFDDPTSILDPEIVAIAERITPNLSKEFGKVWDLFGVRGQPLTTDEFDVYTREYTQPEVVVTASGAGADWDTNNDITALPVSSATIDRITVGDVLLVEDEVVVVKSVDRTGNTIDLYERGAGESSGAAHGTDPITATIIGNAHIESKVDPEAMAEGTGKVVNYVQLVEELIDLSKEDSDQARKIGRTEPVLKGEAMERVMRDLARTAIDGVAVAPTASKPGMTRGLRNWLKLSGGLVTNVGGAFTQAVLDGLIQDARRAGGTVNAIIMSVAKKLTFNTFSSADIVRQDVNERMTGRIIESYLADGMGTIPVIVDLDWPSSEVAVVDTRRLSKAWKTGDELRFENEPPVNSRQKKQSIQGRFGTWVENVGTSHAIATNLT